MNARYLADKSALARAGEARVHNRLAPLIKAGTVARCSLIDLEMLFSARSPTDYAELRVERELLYPLVRIEQATLDRSVEVQSLLAKRSAHRGVPVPDLVIAATAELAGLAVLHYDADFELIAEVTGQPVEWVVPRGSID